MDKILILDFGSQVTQLIARRIRKKNIYCEIHPYNISKKKIDNFSPKGLILSGGPTSTTLKKPLKPDNSIYSLNIPILGICYGQQILCKHLGGKVISSKKKIGYDDLIKSCDIGLSTVSVKKKILVDNLFPSLKTKEDYVAWLKITKNISYAYNLPENFVIWNKSKKTEQQNIIQNKINLDEIKKYCQNRKLCENYK